MSDNQFIYIVRYAATKGILKINKNLTDEVTRLDGKKGIKLKPGTVNFCTSWETFELEKDYVCDEERAYMLAREILEKKVESLVKQARKAQRKLDQAEQGTLKIKEFN